MWCASHQVAGRSQPGKAQPRSRRTSARRRAPAKSRRPRDLRRLFVDPPWLSAHFHDTGTHRGPFLGVPATGRRVRTQEFAVYRVEAGRIAEVWVAADNHALLAQLTGPG